ncbi:MAG: PspC domain-containing protein [Chloroflexota bacterium]
MSEARLTRSNTDQIIAGVCGGIATYLGIDSVLIRLAFLILLFASGIGLPIYFILWIIMPTANHGEANNAETIKQNLDEMGERLYTSVGKVGQPQTIGVVLVALGIFFLFSKMGFVHSGVFWPLLIIGLGVYMLINRR